MQPRIRKRQLIAYLLIFVTAPVITLVLGSWIDNVFNTPIFPIFPWNLFTGISVIVVGLNLGIKSTRQLYKNGRGLPWGEAAHEVETKKLVKTGIYAYTRNPMVLGYSLLPMGMGIMFQSIGMAIALTPAVLVLNYLIVKRREEPRLLKRFGEEYAEYREKTPFLFPDWGRLLSEYLASYIKNNWTKLRLVFFAELSLLIAVVTNYENLPLIETPYASVISDILFASICLLGIIAGITLKHRGRTSRRTNDDPTISFSGRVCCSGCTGLMTGAIIAVMGLTTGFYPFNLEIGFWFGAMLVFLGLAQQLIDFGSEGLHFLLNAAFVVGDWLMYKALQAKDLNIFISIYFLAFTVFWVFTRIRASQ